MRIAEINRFRTTDGKEYEDYAKAERHQDILDKANEVLALLRKHDIITFSNEADIFEFLVDGNNLEQIKNILNKRC